MISFEYFLVPEPDPEPDPLSPVEPHREPCVGTVCFVGNATEFDQLLAIRTLLRYNTKKRFLCAHAIHMAKLQIPLYIASRKVKLSERNLDDHVGFARSMEGDMAMLKFYKESAKLSKPLLKHYAAICSKLEQDAVFVMNLLGLPYEEDIEVVLDDLCHPYYQHLKAKSERDGVPFSLQYPSLPYWP